MSSSVAALCAVSSSENFVCSSSTTRARSAVRTVEEAIKSGDKEAASKALRAAAPVLARTAQKGVLHKKTASRKVSRLTARVKAMAN